MHELRAEPEPGLAELLARLSPVDLVIVEGFKAAAHPKIEVHRAANGKPFLFPEVPNVRAIAAYSPVPDPPVPVLPLDAAGAVPAAALALAEPLAGVIA